MRILITIALTVSCGLLRAQKISVGVEGYMGSFNMSSLRQYQSVSGQYYIPFKNVQNFPARPGIRITGSVKLVDQVSTGILVGYISTGSRLAYSDFTGAAYRDVTVNGLQFGSFNRYNFFNYKRLSLNARMNFGGIVNEVKLDRHIHLQQPEYETREASTWRSVNFYSEMGIEAGLTVDHFFFKIFSSYEFGIPGAMTLKNSSGTSQGGQTFDVNWNGFRGGLGIEYKFLKDN